MGAEVSLQDIDIAHRVSMRRERGGPKPVICKFVRRLAKGNVMEVRQRVGEVNPTSICLSTDTELRGVKIFDHLTSTKQKLLFEAKKLKDRDHYRFCWAKHSVIHLRKDEGSRAIKITDMVLASFAHNEFRPHRFAQNERKLKLVAKVYAQNESCVMLK